MARTIRVLWLAVTICLWAAAAVPLFLAARGLAPLFLQDDPVLRAEALVAGARAPDYEREIGRALKEDDPDLAAELANLAEFRAVPLSPALLSQVAAANRFDLMRSAGSVMRGAVFGEMTSPAGTAAAIATDLTSIGDVRDLVREAAAYPDHDPLIVALAGTGLALTAGTIASGGTSVAITGPAKLGAGLLKLARRSGRLTARLSGDLLNLARRAIDSRALAVTARQAGRLDLVAARRSAARVMRPRETRLLGEAAESVGAIAGKEGPRAALAALSVAETSGDLNALRRIASRFKGHFRAVLRLAPEARRGLLRISKLTWRIGELAALVLGWTLGAFALLTRLIRIVFRLFVAGGARLAGVLPA
ncbi:hypothetical protein [Zhengella mangrovi]|uniref:hypothetical protein n=1 Tax=Zhengella mangrovi TaxID=1982044 RepID=UPI001055280E|nr:hypothetical protein [Zhengella mangrovi]